MEFKNILAVIFSTCLILVLGGITPQPPGRVVGGQDAADNAYPHQVSIQFKYPDQHLGISHFCGGSFVASRFVLTAAHCVQHRDPARIIVFAGTHSLSDSSNGIRLDCEKFIINPEFSANTLQSDIALIKLADKVTFDGVSMVPINLPEPDNDPADPTSVVLSGWGYDHTSTVPDRLQRLNLTTMDTGECAKIVLSFPVGRCHICTVGVKGEGACSGDSGGPLIQGLTQLGIVSFGAPCALGKPDGYCRVSCYTKWIRQIISEES